jgi:hypothetical protein
MSNGFGGGRDHLMAPHTKLLLPGQHAACEIFGILKSHRF